MKYAIVGSRGFPDRKKVTRYIQHLSLIHQDEELIIISGGAKGVDTWAETEAERLGLATEIYLADWENKGKAAGVIRNGDMVKAANRVTVFWDGKSSGTKDMMSKSFKAAKLYDLFIRLSLPYPKEAQPKVTGL